jgi:hypothetical protein
MIFRMQRIQVRPTKFVAFLGRIQLRHGTVYLHRIPRKLVASKDSSLATEVSHGSAKARRRESIEGGVRDGFSWNPDSQTQFHS